MASGSGGRRLGVALVVFGLLAALQLPSVASANGPTALFVTGNGARVPAGDAGPVAELEGLGYQVLVVDDDAVQQSDAATADLVVISTSVSPPKVGSIFRDEPVPLLTWEPFLYDGLAMTAGGSARGEVANQSTLDIVEPGHPMAAGLSGRTTVQTTKVNVVYGQPSSDATVVATVAGQGTRAAIFAYESGDDMVGQVAPARRVGFYTSYAAPRTWNTSGAALFRAAVSWIADPVAAVNRAPSVDAGPDLLVEIGDTVSLDGTVTDDGLPDPPAAVDSMWSGPPSVTFGDPSQPSTTATFGSAGTQTLTLGASDGELTGTDTVVVTVRDPSQVNVALFISSRTSPPAVERPAAERLETLGFDVVYADDNQVTPADAAAADLVVIGSSVSPGALDADIADVEVPVMIWERRLYDEFGFIARGRPNGEGTGRAIKLVGDGHPTLAGLTGTVTVYNRSDRLSWTQPEGDVTVLATQTNNAQRVTMFSYERGALMADSPAPARRLGFFSALRGPSRFTDDAWQLYDASVLWLAADAPQNNPPAVDAGADVTVVEGGTVTLAGAASDDGLPDPPGTLTTTWSGPTGVVFDQPNTLSPTVSFPGPGTFVLRLTGDDGELTHFDELEVEVTPNPLQADIVADVVAGPAPLTVNFDGGGSSDPGGSVEAWDWDFGDGITASGETASHTFAVGVHLVTLLVTDDDGLTDSATVIVSVGEVQPVASAVSDVETLTTPGPVAFDGTGSTDPDGIGIATWTWDFGDGSTASGSTVAHSYDRIGVFAAELTVTTTDGRTDRDRLLIRVGDADSQRIDHGLVALYDFTNGSGSAVGDRSGVEPALDLIATDPAALQWLGGGGLRLLTPTSLVSSGPATKVHDGLTASGAVTIEAWIDPAVLEPAEPGRVVTLSPDDSIRNLALSQGAVGAGGSQIEARLVSAQSSEQGYPAAETALGTLDGDLVHVVFARDPGGRQRIWLDGQLTDEAEVGGGLVGWDPTFPLAIGADPNGARAWLGDLHLVAIYDRALSGDEVCWNLAAGPGRVVGATDVAPYPCASLDIAGGAGPLPVEVDGRGSSDPEGAIVSYLWDFGDGATATGPTAQHIYADGDHELTLTVTDSAGTTVTSSTTVVVRQDPDLPSPPIGFDDAFGLRASGGLFDLDPFLRAEAWTGTSIRWTSQFLERGGPLTMAATAQTLLAPGGDLVGLGSQVDLNLAVPLGFGNANARTEAGRAQIAANLQAVAAGDHDTQYLEVAQALVDGGHGDAVLRLGHEFNGVWPPWSAQQNPTDFIAAWRHVHDLFESVSPNFQFDWNSARGPWTEFGPPAYPGDAYVDIISIDIYWRIEPDVAPWAQNRWRNQFESILIAHRDFAVARGKQVAYPEWGLLGGDEPRFIEAMYAWFVGLPDSGPGSLAYQIYFNSGSTGEELADHPAARATFIELFGGTP